MPCSLLLEKYGNYVENGDPVIKTYPGFSSPAFVLSICTVYLTFVLKLGPWVMKNRKAFQLRGLILGYNCVQIICNLLLFYNVATLIISDASLCLNVLEGVTPVEMWKTNAQYAYFVLKVFDTLDTVFFVLRKKHNQVSFMHVYHHVSMVALPWLNLFNYRWGQCLYIVLVNTLIHALMYAYYSVTIWNPNYVNMIWWKKNLTQLQMVQHILLFLTSGVSLVCKDCTSPKHLDAFNALQAGLVLFLFWGFYKKSYKNKCE